MERQRSAIIELFMSGKRQCDIMRSLNIPKERRKCVYSTIQRYLETSNVKDKSRSRRPITVTTTRMKKIIRDRIRRNPRRSMRKLSSELKISRISVHKIVKSSLGLSSYKRRKGVKVNSTEYKDRILEPVVKDLGACMFNKNRFLFQQDGAPAHTARTTQTWLSENIPDFITKDEWQPSSPDLNPMDLSLWAIMEEMHAQISY
ncbi:hypothetical protein LOD99_11090 [Oopsacas minuta]|uniref:Paired domain-containing protein n=1 Tax=Oopsacas minuta TaxID=111878 RepID=A0AAV7KCB0_9METZ|nr:hypothetical protein LOD99_11090 [Oopsacas minuta]